MFPKKRSGLRYSSEAVPFITWARSAAKSDLAISPLTTSLRGSQKSKIVFTRIPRKLRCPRYGSIFGYASSRQVERCFTAAMRLQGADFPELCTVVLRVGATRGFALISSPMQTRHARSFVPVSPGRICKRRRSGSVHSRCSGCSAATNPQRAGRDSPKPRSATSRPSLVCRTGYREIRRGLILTKRSFAASTRLPRPGNGGLGGFFLYRRRLARRNRPGAHV